MPKPEPLFLTEAQIAERIGLPLSDWQEVARVLDKQGLPPSDPLFKNRRYWPACKAFLDRRHGLASPSAAQHTGKDEEEHWEGMLKPRPKKKHRS